MEINLHFHEGNKNILQKLADLTIQVEQLVQKEIIMSEQLDKLTAEVAETVTVQQSAILLL